MLPQGKWEAGTSKLGNAQVAGMAPTSSALRRCSCPS